MNMVSVIHCIGDPGDCVRVGLGFGVDLRHSALIRQTSSLLSLPLFPCAGDDVKVYGVVIRRWKSFVSGNRCDIDLAIQANHLEVANAGACSQNVSEDAQRDFRQFWESHAHNPLSGSISLLFRHSLCLARLTFYSVGQQYYIM